MSAVQPDAMIRSLRASGKRVTRERELLVRIIAQNAHLDADEIHRRARREQPRIGLATVYRTLSLLQELDIVTSADLGEPHSHYECRAGDHLHLVCSTCGKVVDAPVPTAVTLAAEREGFAVQRAHLQVFGVCAACATKPVPPEAMR